MIKRLIEADTSPEECINEIEFIGEAKWKPLKGNKNVLVMDVKKKRPLTSILSKALLSQLARISKKKPIITDVSILPSNYRISSEYKGQKLFVLFVPKGVVGNVVVNGSEIKLGDKSKLIAIGDYLMYGISIGSSSKKGSPEHGRRVMMFWMG